MESLQLTCVMSCKLSTNISRKGCGFRPSRQIGYGHLSRRSFRHDKLMVIRSESTGNGGGFGGLADGSNSNAVEEEKEEGEKEKNGLMLGIDRDVSGAVIGLHLIPPSGIFFPLFLNYWDFHLNNSLFD